MQINFFGHKLYLKDCWGYWYSAEFFKNVGDWCWCSSRCLTLM